MRFTLPFKKTLASLLAGLLLASAASVTVSALEPHGTGLKMRNWLVNDPAYDFSEAYKTSVWYENFSSLELGENDRNNVLRVAVSQLGYHEGDSEAEIDGTNPNGSKNFVEYWNIFNPKWKPQPDDAYWCACFVNWCLNQARFDRASSEISCGNWIAELKTMGMWQVARDTERVYAPSPADLIFFDWNADNWSDHVGLVLYATTSHVYTIEGNTKTNDVALRSYSLTDTQILGYGTPPYDEGAEPTMDFSYANGMPVGIYIVGTAGLRLTDSLGQNPGDSVPLGSMVRLLTVTDELALVAYGDKTGYLPQSSLCLMTQEFTLTYDANGGQNPPTATSALHAEAHAVTDASPVLEGDTFLGWSTVLYNVKVDFKPGDPIHLTQDTTLYAVWENHSKQLAKAAVSLGLLPEYERPNAIRNSGAILLGTLKSTDVWTNCIATKPLFTTDEALGNVLSFAASDENATHGATLTYGALCEVLRLAPRTCEGTAHVILRIKDVQNSRTSITLTVNDKALPDAVKLAEHDGWQYVVFDLNGTGLRGNVSTVRIDWTSEDAGSVLQIADLWLTPNSAVKDAVLDGKYVYPDMELLQTESTTATTTAPAVESESAAEPGTTEPTLDSTRPPEPSDTTVGNDESSTTAPTDKSGCFAMIRTSAWVGAVLLACVPVILVKKKDDGAAE